MSLKAATKTDTNRVELEIDVDAEAFNAAIGRAYRKNIMKMNVPGFRKGKAPRHLVEKMYGESVFYEDAMNDLYPDALDGAIKESGYEYVEDKIDLDVVTVGKDGLVFKAVITVKPEVEVSRYKGLEGERIVEPVTDDDVAAELEKLQNRNSRLDEATARPAADGDTVTIDYEGFVDGAAFDGGKGKNHSLTLGSGTFIPGFEEQVVGKSADDEFDVEVTFPEEYHADNLAGKAAVFKCRLHEIKAREMPELNDEFAKDVSEFDTLDELKQDIKGKLEHQREHAADDAFETALLDQLADAVTGDIPEAMYKNRVDESVRSFENRLQSQGLNLPTYLQYTGMDMDGFRDGFKTQAEKQVKTRLALEKIVVLEAIEPTAEEIEAEYAKLAEQYKMEADKVKGIIDEAALKKDLAVGKAMDLVKESAVPPAEKTKAKSKKGE